MQDTTTRCPLLQMRRAPPRSTTHFLLQGQACRRKTLQLLCPKRGDFRPPTLASPEERPATSTDDDIEELTTTQREGPKLTAAGLPRKKPQNQKGKGRKPATTNRFTVLGDIHDLTNPTSHPADPANHPSYFDPTALPESGITNWGDEVNDTMFTEIPDISATPESRGPSLEPPAQPITTRELRVTDKLRVVDHE
ncbi:hypothetical protein V8E53_000427, partial [Lactarius tabidus]